MRIEFVNHASFVIEAQGVRLISDPWLDGTAFDDSWALLARSTFQHQDFASITHLWFSHEHPDHFHPPTLKRIPPELRARITVLFQRTVDRKVVEFCAGLGFGAVRELPPDEWVELAPGFEVLCMPFAGFQDSWLCVRTPGVTLLNLNDCPVFEREQARAIRRRVGPIDVLATQFSISAWDGNAEELERRRSGARKMLARALMHCEELEPRFVLPIASYIWFCHEENAFMNEGFLPLAEVVGELARGSRARPVPMYPGDAWTVGADFDPEPALARYARDQSEVATRPRVAARHVSPEELMAESRRYARAMGAGSDPLRHRLRCAAASVRLRGRRAGRLGDLATLAWRALSPEPATIHVVDHARSYAFDPVRGLVPIERDAARCDVSLSSQALAYAFRFLWGGETLLFNGRFREGRADGKALLFDYFHLAGARNSGATARWSSLPRDIARRVRRSVVRRPRVQTS